MIYNGCSTLVGASLGDSMGSYCEFTAPNEINCKAIWTEINPIFNTARGQLTDDTEMANSMALGILESLNKFGLDNTKESKLKINFIAYYYLFWFSTEPFDIGNTTYNALNIKLDNIMSKQYEYSDNFLISKMQSNSKALNSSSLSNGFLMRHTPMTVFLYYFFEINENNTKLINFKRYVEEKRFEDLFLFLINFILEEIRLTHFNLECVVAAAIYDFLIISILTRKKQEEIIDFDDSKDLLVLLIQFLETLMKSTNKNIEKLKENIKKILESLKIINEMNDFEEESNKNELLKIGQKNIGYYMHAMNLIFFIIKFLHIFETNKEFGIYRNIINFICNKGGDTDTNCCIVGGVIGAIIGIKKIDKQYLKTHLKFYPGNTKNNVQREFIYAPSVLTFYGIKLISVLNKQISDMNDSKKGLQEVVSEDVSLSMIENILIKDLETEAKNLEQSLGSSVLESISELI